MLPIKYIGSKLHSIREERKEAIRDATVHEDVLRELQRHASTDANMITRNEDSYMAERIAEMEHEEAMLEKARKRLATPSRRILNRIGNLTGPGGFVVAGATIFGVSKTANIKMDEAYLVFISIYCAAGAAVASVFSYYRIKDAKSYEELAREQRKYSDS